MTGQGIQAFGDWRQIPARRRCSHSPIHRLDQTSGFSLVELMIVAGLTAVVLAGLGALTLVSDVKVGQRLNSLQEAQEEWGRVVTFIQNEVADDAASLSDTLSSAYDCGEAVPNPLLVLNPPTSTIIYGVRNRTNREIKEGLYRGPKLLVRCGPLPGATTPQSETVLLDRLPSNNPLKVRLLADKLKGPVFDAELTITMETGTDSTFAGDQPFRVHVQRTP